MIRLNDVTKVYPNGSKGVEGLNLHIKKGDFVFIVGSSGSGKSTLIKLLLKELDPTSGEIIINRVKTNELSRRQIPYLHRNLGVVFQDFRLLPNKTVYENVAFAMRVIDEPTGNLDPETAWGIMQLLDDINKRGTTIVMATHAKDIVDAMQKRVVTLKRGHIIRDIEKGGYDDEA